MQLFSLPKTKILRQAQLALLHPRFPYRRTPVQVLRSPSETAGFDQHAFVGQYLVLVGWLHY